MNTHCSEVCGSLEGGGGGVGVVMVFLVSKKTDMFCVIDFSPLDLLSTVMCGWYIITAVILLELPIISV